MKPLGRGEYITGFPWGEHRKMASFFEVESTLAKAGMLAKPPRKTPPFVPFVYVYSTGYRELALALFFVGGASSAELTVRLSALKNGFVLSFCRRLGRFCGT